MIEYLNEMIDWIIDFIDYQPNKRFTDDMYDYNSKDINKDILNKLNEVYTVSYKLYTYANNNFIDTEVFIDKDDIFTVYSVVLNIRNKYIQFEYLSGQGSFTFVKLLDLDEISELSKNQIIDYDLFIKNEPGDLSLQIKDKLNSILDYTENFLNSQKNISKKNLLRYIDKNIIFDDNNDIFIRKTK